jgi:hypothetical protein
VIDPVRRGAAGTEGVLQAAVEAFYHPVRLRVVVVVWLCWMLSRLQRAAHREEVNWALRSDVMTAGTPKRLTYP